jgi:AcrR family transcriptional regulator
VPPRSAPAAPGRRGPGRRDLLLSAAADLFSTQGYHAVGIDDIGAAAGISGPGVYRHFAGKQALLGQLCDRVMTRMLDGAQEIARRGTGLDALLDLHVRFAVDERALLGVWAREQRALDDDLRRSLRVRQRAYEQVWGDVVAPLRPDLTRDEAQLTVTATLALLNATALVETRVPPERLLVLLPRMARATLLQAVG